jgi:hypothetical protein
MLISIGSSGTEEAKWTNSFFVMAETVNPVYAWESHTLSRMYRLRNTPFTESISSFMRILSRYHFVSEIYLYACIQYSLLRCIPNDESRFYSLFPAHVADVGILIRKACRSFPIPPKPSTIVICRWGGKYIWETNPKEVWAAGEIELWTGKQAHTRLI